MTIYERARPVIDIARGRANYGAGRAELHELSLTPALARWLKKLVIVACGTSAFSASFGKSMVEKLARLPVEFDRASEFGYCDPVIGPDSAALPRLLGELRGKLPGAVLRDAVYGEGPRPLEN